MARRSDTYPHQMLLSMTLEDSDVLDRLVERFRQKEPTLSSRFVNRSEVLRRLLRAAAAANVAWLPPEMQAEASSVTKPRARRRRA